MSEDEVAARRTKLTLKKSVTSTAEVLGEDGTISASTLVIQDVEIEATQTDFVPIRGKLRITKNPRIGEIYWCSFPEDSLPPEFGKIRPVMIVSPTNVLGTFSTVVPLTRSPQEVTVDNYSHPLSFRPDPSQRYDSWVVASHVYTISHWRLAPFVHRRQSHYPRVGDTERQTIIDLMQSRLPANQKLRQVEIAEERQKIEQNKELRAKRMAERALIKG